MDTLNEVIAKLQALSAQGHGNLPFCFGDGSPVRFDVTDKVELTSTKMPTKAVQVRLDMDRLKKTA